MGLGTSQVQVVPIRCFAGVFACSCRLTGVPGRAEYGYLHSNVKTHTVVVHVPLTLSTPVHRMSLRSSVLCWGRWRTSVTLHTGVAQQYCRYGWSTLPLLQHRALNPTEQPAPEMPFALCCQQRICATSSSSSHPHVNELIFLFSLH